MGCTTSQLHHTLIPTNPGKHIKPVPMYIGKNLFFDILPRDIMEKIYIMRIDNILNGHKKIVIDMIDNLPKKNCPLTGSKNIYYDPFDPAVYLTLSTALHTLTYSDICMRRYSDRVIKTLMEPTLRGIELFSSLTMFLNLDSENRNIYTNLYRLHNKFTIKLCKLIWIETDKKIFGRGRIGDKSCERNKILHPAAALAPTAIAPTALAAALLNVNEAEMRRKMIDDARRRQQRTIEARNCAAARARVHMEEVRRQIDMLHAQDHLRLTPGVHTYIVNGLW
jgi:hypothetical protein